MQKKLIALAVVAAFSTPAFADATMYGAVDAAIVNASGTGQKSDMITLSGGAGASRIGFNAAEELDNGLKAVVNLEYGLDTQIQGGDFAARQELLGLAGGFGTVATGYLQTTGYDWEVKFDPIAGSAVSALQSMNKSMLIGTVAGAARAPRALAYISPNMGGVTVAVNYTTELAGGLGAITQPSTSQMAKSTAYLISGTYAEGPLAVGVVMASADSGKTAAGAQAATNVDDMAVGASFDFGVAKLMGTYQTSKAKVAAGTSTTAKAMSVSAVIPAGPGVVGVQYANHKSAAANSGASGMTVGYLLPMSKTVTAYAAYESVKNQSATNTFSADNNALTGITAAVPAGTLTNGGTSSVIAVGLRKKF
jgi:predicted porin